MDFARAFLHREQLTTLMVVYYRPDFQSLLQEFTWQFLDEVPRFPRVHRFLNHWKTEIRAPIREVKLAVAGHLIPMDWSNSTIFSA